MVDDSDDIVMRENDPFVLADLDLLAEEAALDEAAREQHEADRRYEMDLVAADLGIAPAEPSRSWAPTITLSGQQETAVARFADWWDDVGSLVHDIGPSYTQQGYAGTGKTTVLPFFIQKIGLDPVADVTYVAPTGKAAKVMTKKLRDQGIMTQAVTVHKAIYRPKGLQYVAIESKIGQITEMLKKGEGNPVEHQRTLKMLHRDLERAYDQNSPSFQLNPDSAIKNTKLIVCDEASMVGEGMADDILFFGVPVLAIGDPGQLQPVGDRPGFFIGRPNHVLTEIHRQALDNPIIWYSREIREGRDPGLGSHGDGALRIIDRKHDDVTFDRDRDVQIICGANATRHRITRRLRKESGLDLMGPQEGELMICVKNSQKHPTIVNGTMLMMRKSASTLEAGDLTIPLSVTCEDKFNYDLSCVQAVLEETYLGKGNWTASKRAVRHAQEDKSNHQIDWAYVITCHKSQGSQWNDVVVHDESGMFREEADKWLYTAVTRAAETLTVVKM